MGTATDYELIENPSNCVVPILKKLNPNKESIIEHLAIYDDYTTIKLLGVFSSIIIRSPEKMLSPLGGSIKLCDYSQSELELLSKFENIPFNELEEAAKAEGIYRKSLM